MTANAPMDRSEDAAVSLGETLDKVAGEVSEGAKALSALQWTVSSLLEKLHHPDLAAEVQMLQDIDRLHQTYVDLAAVLEHAARFDPPVLFDPGEMKQVMRLDSLKARMFGEGEDESDACDETDVSWF